MDSSNSNRQGSSRRGHRIISSYKKDPTPTPDADPTLDAFKKKNKHNTENLYAQPSHINTLDANTQPIGQAVSPNPNKHSYASNSSSGEKGDLSKTNKLQLQRDKLKRERQKRDNKATDSEQNPLDEDLIDMNKSLYNLEFFNRTNKSRIYGNPQKNDNGYADDIDAILNRGNDMRAGRADPGKAFSIINDTAALKKKNNWDYDIGEIGGYDPQPSRAGGNFKKKGFGRGEGLGLSQELKMLGIKNDAQKNAMFGAPGGGGPPESELRAKDKGASLGNQPGLGVVDFGYKNFEDIVARNSKFSMPKNPYGKKLSFRIFSTWGEKFYVGLCGIEVFNADGIPIKIPGSCISATPRDLTILPDYSDDPRKLEN